MTDRQRYVERVFEIPVVVAALFVIPVVVIEATSSIGRPWTTIAEVVNWSIWVVFAAELGSYLLVVGDRRRWLREHPLEVLVVVLTPPFLPSSLQAIRALRLLRLVRLLRLAQVARRIFSMQGLRYVGLLAVLTALGGGAAFAAVEREHTTWDGVWWAVSTMTTVGYGDLYPKTSAGRFIGIAVMLVGIGFIAILTGAVAQRFLVTEIEEVADSAAEIEATDVEVLAELREVRVRLDRLEARLERRS